MKVFFFFYFKKIILEEKNGTLDAVMKELSPIKEIIEPFLETNLYFPVVHTTAPTKVPIFGYERNFKNWLTTWSLRLLPFVEGPKKPIFISCRTVIKDDLETALFLFPYIISEVLVLQKDTTVENEIHLEIQSVLETAAASVEGLF